MKPRNSLILAAAIAAVGVTIAFRAIHRGAPRQESIVSLTPPGFTPFATIRTDVRPTENTLDTLIDRLKDRVASLASAEFASQDLPPHAADELASLVAERVRAILTGDADRIRSIAVESGALHIPDPSDLTPERFAIVSKWSTVWRMAHVSIDDVAVRRLLFDESPEALRQRARTTSRSALRARYPAPAPDALVYEVAVPMRPLNNQAAGRGGPVYVGISHQWDRAGERWIGHNLTVYSDDVVIAPPPM